MCELQHGDGIYIFNANTVFLGFFPDLIYMCKGNKLTLCRQQKDLIRILIPKEKMRNVSQIPSKYYN